ncbi:MAG: deoxynucleoside kinase [Saprospiraceae bacterium]|nr:deoxynucleoside kinase [Saprospiraceae bacterium]
MKNNIPYKYICIEGNIGAGKTTLSQMLAEEFSCNLILEQFTENPFLEYFYKDPERYAFTVELSFLTERHKQLQSQLKQNDLFGNINLADYSMVKSLLFAKQNLSPEEFRLFQNIFNLLSHNIPRPDLILYLHRPIERVKKHILDRARQYELNIQNEYLESIQNTYFDFFKTQTLVPVVLLDGENMDFINIPSHFDEIKNILSQEFKPGLHHLRIIF